MSDPKPPDVLTLEEAAKLLRLSTKTVARLAMKKAFPARKLGREWRFTREALLGWVNGRNAA